MSICTLEELEPDMGHSNESTAPPPPQYVSNSNDTIYNSLSLEDNFSLEKKMSKTVVPQTCVELFFFFLIIFRKMLVHILGPFLNLFC